MACHHATECVNGSFPFFRLDTARQVGQNTVWVGSGPTLIITCDEVKLKRCPTAIKKLWWFIFWIRHRLHKMRQAGKNTHIGPSLARQ